MSGGLAVQARLSEALQARAALLGREDLTAFRVANAEADGLPGIVVDRFAEVAVVSLYRELPLDEEAALLDAVHRVLDARAVYLKRRPREARVVANTQKDLVAPPLPERGEAVDALTVREHGLSFRIRPGQGLSVGLYLDMREVRAWLRARAAGARVLNLFAYTCAFGVCAQAGGAARAVNVDLSRRVLDWGQENYALNALPTARQDFIAGDVFDWLARLSRKEEKFDRVVLDPPSFSTGRGSRFSAAKDYARLVAAAAPLVSSGGLLVACCNLAELPAARFEAQIEGGLGEAGRNSRLVERLGPSEVDFPCAPGRPPGLKVRVHALS